MSFADDLQRFTAKVETRTRDVFVNVAAHVLTSVRDGSPVTGAPGQPVDTGNLKASWQLRFDSPTSAEVSTNVEYAPQNEDGIARPGGGQYTQKSPVGGRFSVAITAAGIQKILDAEVVKAGGSVA
jgi:hypothetical protein